VSTCSSINGGDETARGIFDSHPVQFTTHHRHGAASRVNHSPISYPTFFFRPFGGPLATRDAHSREHATLSNLRSAILALDGCFDALVSNLPFPSLLISPSRPSTHPIRGFEARMRLDRNYAANFSAECLSTSADPTHLSLVLLSRSSFVDSRASSLALESIQSSPVVSCAAAGSDGAVTSHSHRARAPRPSRAHSAWRA
jgi:hypothetical protein